MRRPTTAVLLGLLWITVFGSLDLRFPDVSFFGSLSLAAVGVSLFASARAAAAVWAYAFIWAMVTGVGAEGYWSGFYFFRLAVSLFIGGSAVAIALVRERREHRFEVITDVALAAQRALLREPPERVDGVRVAARYVSAAEDALVGGDFFEAVATPFGARVVIGDVVGRGLEAVGLAGLVLGGFREAALTAPDLAELARRLDATVQAFTAGEEYATALIAEFRGREVRLVSCGHPFPLLLDDGELPIAMPLPTNLPLGYGAEPTVTSRTLREGERVFLATDGLEEARDADGRFFDVVGEGGEALSERDPDVALDRLLVRLRDHVGGELRDDVALLLLEPSDR